MTPFAPAWRVALALAVVAAAGCSRLVAESERDLDSGLYPVPSELLSVAKPHPTEAELNRPVLVATHGFSSTIWEGGPLAEAMTRRGMAVSRVNLGAHGTSLEDFARSDWRAWSRPILAEYKALRSQGYKHVSIMGHSTGGTLWLRALADGQLGVVPERMVFIAPLIEFATPTRGIYLAGILPFFGVEAIDRPLTGSAVGHLYRKRPVSALQSLTELTVGVRRSLKTGLALPMKTRMLVVQGDEDGVVDPAGAETLVAGIVGPTPTLMKVHSWMHNPVGPDGHFGVPFTPEEAALRERILDRIADHLLAP